MNIDTNDFFIEANSVHGISDEDYQNADLLVNAAKAFAQCTHQCVYIIDYFKKNFLYVSDNFSRWCGLTTEKIKESGYEFYIQYVPEPELKMLLEINRKGFYLFEDIPVYERMDYTISYDFNIEYGKKKRLINHNITPMILDKNGHIWLALCTFSMSARITPGHIIMKKNDSDSYYEYSLEKHKWITKKNTILSEMERDVLVFSAQGYTMEVIADKLCRSVDTIKACKRNLFAKLNVKNIAEALAYATNHRLL